MTAKELLKRIIKLRKAIDYRETKIKILEAECERTTAQITGMPHGQGNGNSQMESGICKKLDLEREIESINAEREALIARIDLIDDEDLTKLLSLRYRHEEPWDDIMTEMGYCESHIFRLHQQALKLLDAALKDESK